MSEGNAVIKANDEDYLSVDEKVMMAIVRAAENFKRAHSSIFMKYGLSFPQYNILRVLQVSENGQSKTGTVGRNMLVTGPNITGPTKRLEKEGFIVRTRDPGDERVTLLVITPKGRKTLALIEDEKNASIEMILKDISGDEKLNLLSTVRGLIQSTGAFQKELG